MKAYRVKTGRQLEILGDPIGEAPILNIPLAQYQESIFQELELSLTDVGDLQEIDDKEPHFVFDDDLFFTKGFVRQFLADAGKAPGNAVAAMPANYQWKAIAALQDHVTVHESDVRYHRFRYIDPGAQGEPRPILIDTETGFLWRQRWPQGVLSVTESFHPVTDRYLIQIVIPMHLIMANIFARFDRIARIYRDGKLAKIWQGVEAIARILGKMDQLTQWVAERRLWRAKKGLPKIAYKVFGKLNNIGKDCDIHPTAVVEACDIGDNVHIGAYSVLQFATIGDGVEIGEYCHMRICSVGAGTCIPQISRISMSVVFPDVFWAARSVNFGVVGRQAQLYFSLYTDYRLGGLKQTTFFHQKLVDAVVPFLGVCIGHRAIVAGGLITAPGRVIPNGVTVLPPIDLVYTKAPPGTKEGDIIRLGKKD